MSQSNYAGSPATAINTATDVTPMKRVAAACLVGSIVEFYDFLIYGTAAALVFPTVFFPHLGAAMATIASMGTFAAAFVSRPLGALVFGHLGDRLGRKKTLVATLLIMALSAGVQSRRCCWRRHAAADRRSTADELRRLGDRFYAGRRCRSQPGVHVPAPRNQRNYTSIHSSTY
jgi:hypothetical protein